ncbi:MAG: C25 family cysteine peptidase [Candidatus Eisenbacteria bacterium]
MTSVLAHRPRLSLWFATLVLLAAACLPAAVAAAWVDLGGDPLAPVTVSVLQSDDERTVLEIEIGGFSAEPLLIDGRTFQRITLNGESDPHEKGLPALPDVRRSIMIPGDRRMKVNVLSLESVDFPAMPVAPSRGHFSREIDPASVPYTFDAFYQGHGTYPAQPAEGHAPYILRDLRGMVVDANVFQYLAGEQTLRVHTRMIVEVVAAGPDDFNVLDSAPPQKADRQFAKLYAEHFINLDAKGSRYAPVPEEGGILIITYDSFHAYVEPLYQWKLQKGIPAKLVDKSQVGTTSTQIQAYIQQEYDAWHPAYVLLVGDATQMPTISYGNGSDPSYALVAGSDTYPDLFIGRFSAENADQVITQVERTIAYERDMTAGLAWPQSGTGIASNQGPGDDNEYDNQHEDNIRADLLAYGYAAVDQIYDPTATAAQVSAALNAGRGIVNYTGHGSTQSWSTTGFSNTQVAALTNDQMLPFICSVACLNGNFQTSTCFAEAWLRAAHNGVPSGAIACYMSTISQDWDPPMAMQDEAVDLLVADAMRTAGGLWFNGACLMMDEYGSSGVNEFKCWTIFGDPSLTVRTKAAQEMTVNHPSAILLGESECEIVVPGETDALCALYADGVLYGSAATDAGGAALIALDPVPAEPLMLTVTVTAYNRVTYIGTLEVIPPSGPHLLVDDTFIVDGNGDGILNSGEGLHLSILVRNAGITAAGNVSGLISTTSEYVTLTLDTRSYGFIPAAGEKWSQGSYQMTIAPDCPDQYPLDLAVLLTGDERGSGTRLTWEDEIHLTVQAPSIGAPAVWIDDSESGNGNGRLDPGESAAVVITLSNTGHYALTDITGDLATSHPLADIAPSTASLNELGYPASGALDPAFGLTLDPAFAQSYLMLFLYVEGSNGFDRTYDLLLPVGGYFEVFETGFGGWTHAIVNPSYQDQWHLSTQRNHTVQGGQSWKCGDTGTGTYANLLDAGLVSVPLELSGAEELRFWMWIDAEISSSYPGKAYDGGLIEMSLDGGPFTQLTPVGGYAYTIRAGGTPGPFPADTPVFSGTSSSWQQVVCDLSGVTGSAVFRFRFGSDGAVAKEGWYVDDVELLTNSSPADVRGVELMPARMALGPSMPNPSRGDSRIRFGMPGDGRVCLQIFDSSGRLVRTLVDERLAAGFHTIHWDGRSGAGDPASSGIYFYRLTGPEGTLRRSMVLSR